MQPNNRFDNGMFEIAWRDSNGNKQILISRDRFAQKGPITIKKVLDHTNILSFTVQTTAPIVLEHCRWSGTVPVQAHAKIFANGYQSWSQAKESGCFGRTKGMGWLGRLVESRHHLSAYGAYKFGPQPGGPGVFIGWSWMSIRAADDWELYGSCNERVGFTSITLRCKISLLIRNLFIGKQPGLARLELSRDIQGMQVAAGQSVNIIDVGYFQGNGNAVFDQWFAAQKINPPTALPCSGWTSWYKHYDDISETKILSVLGPWTAGLKNRETKKLVTAPSKTIGTIPRWLGSLSIFQIDDGWQSTVGDWLTIREDRFPSGMKFVAHSIRQAGFRPGLWLAPFAVVPGSEIAKSHPHWLVTDSTGKPLLSGTNWGGFHALDLDIPEVKLWLRQVFKTIFDDWGFELVKLDFLYALCQEPRHGKSRGQLMSEGMDFIRECAGEQPVLACGVPLAAAFGRVEYCRIGCDVGLDWDDRWHYRFLHKERVSTKNALDNTWGRRMLNGRAFLNDPDVWIGRNDPKVRLTKKQKSLLHKSNLEFGGLVFTSDDWDEIPAEWKKGD